MYISRNPTTKIIFNFQPLKKEKESVLFEGIKKHHQFDNEQNVNCTKLEQCSSDAIYNSIPSLVRAKI